MNPLAETAWWNHFDVMTSRGMSAMSTLTSSPSAGDSFYRARAQTSDGPGAMPLQPGELLAACLHQDACNLAI